MKCFLLILLVPVSLLAQTYHQGHDYTHTLSAFAKRWIGKRVKFKVVKTEVLEGQSNDFLITDDSQAKFKCFLRIEVDALKSAQGKLPLARDQEFTIDPKTVPADMSGISISGFVQAVTTFEKNSSHVRALICQAKPVDDKGTTHQLFYNMSEAQFSQNISAHLTIVK